MLPVRQIQAMARVINLDAVIVCVVHVTAYMSFMHVYANIVNSWYESEAASGTYCDFGVSVPDKRMGGETNVKQIGQ